MMATRRRQLLTFLTNLLGVMALTQPAMSQERYGLPIHKFFLNPFVEYATEAEVLFTDSEVMPIRFTQPIVYGAEKTRYQQVYLHKRIPGFVFLQNPSDIPPELEELYPKPYIKLLNEFRDHYQDEVKFYARVFLNLNGAAKTSCLDKKFASKFKDEANLIFDFGRGNYFSPQTFVAVAFRRPSGQSMGSLAEIVFANSGTETVVYLHYGNSAPSNPSALQEAGFYGDSPMTLPAGFSGQSNVQQPGSWIFRISDAATSGGVTSANVDLSLRRSLDSDNRKLGFLPDRFVGCHCDRCHSKAVCVGIEAGIIRMMEGSARCCRCQGVNAYIGNGLECLDAGTPLPVTYHSKPWPNATSAGEAGELQTNVTFIRGNLDISAQPASSDADSQLMSLVKLSDPAWTNLALLTASTRTNRTSNLFALGDILQRRLEFTVSEPLTGERLAEWAIEQTVWNQVLLKGISTRLIVKQSTAATPSIILMLNTDAARSAVEYGFTEVQRSQLRLESKPVSYIVSALTAEMPRELRVNYTDAWTLRPSCEVETRVARLVLETSYERSDLPTGTQLTRLTGTVTQLVTCADLTCGNGAECRVTGPLGQATCQCLPNYQRADGQPKGPCRAVCGSGTLCHEKADCLLNKCMCNVGFSGDGVTCRPDPLDCRLALASCRSEDGSTCMQRPTASSSSSSGDVEYRCQCTSSKCAREADAACRRQHGCSQFADCLEVGVCFCQVGFQGDGKTCLPDTCADAGACVDAGPRAFCNATRQCEVCPPAKELVEGRCQSRPCRPGDCHELAECNPTINACVCKPGFTGDGVSNCSLVCSSLRDCNRDVRESDLADLAGHMQCRAGACECLPGYRPVLDRVSRILSCRNCENDLDCLPGATCQFEMRFTNARICKCPEGTFGNGASACHQCGGEPHQSCGINAECQEMPNGRVCRCKYGYSGPDPRKGCVKDDTRLMLNATQLQLFEGQTDISVSCRVIRGPVRPVNLVWTSVRDIPIPLDEDSRITQYLLGDRKVLQISRVTKADAREIYCLPDVDGEQAGVETLKITVLENPCPRCHTLAFCNFTKPGCQCSLGYIGDGVARCDKASCTEQQLCDPATELCLYSQATGKYGCECAPGLERGADGRCQRRREACETSADCHTSADCALVDGRRQCRCREGFSGDGVRHCEPTGPGCNFHNRCAKNSECLYSIADGKYRCVCTSGHLGNGDVECRLPARCAECRQNGGQCDQQSIENRALDGRSEQVQLDVCRCPEGRKEVRAKGQTLCRTPAQISRTLYVAQGDSILRIPAESTDDSRLGLFVSMSSALSPSAGGSNSPRGGAPIVGLDYNCRAKEFIWSVYGHRQLFSVKADKGGDTTRWEPLGSGMERVEGLAVDWTTGNTYYTAQYVSSDEETRGSRFGEIGVVASRRGVAYKKVLFRGPKDGVVRPRGIAVDPFLGKIYYTDWDRKDPRIMTAYMNGEGHVKLASTMGLLPNGIIRRFDSNVEEVCYTGADYPLNKSAKASSQRPASQIPVQCIWSPGAEPVERRNYRTTWMGEPFGLAYADNQLYWTNWRSNKLAAYDMPSGRATDRGVLGSPDNRLMGIVAVSADCPTTRLAQKSDHACSETRDYGGCKYLCLAAPNGGVKCVCPDDNPTCSP